MYSNGFMLAEAGTATVACMSHDKMIPVVAVSETFKFSKKAMLDTFINDELDTWSQTIDGIKVH